MAPADDAAAVRGMGEGDGAVVALGYVQVQFVGNGEQAPVRYAPAHPAPQDSPLEDSCSPCKKFLLVNLCPSSRRNKNPYRKHMLI